MNDDRRRDRKREKREREKRERKKRGRQEPTRKETVRQSVGDRLERLAGRAKEWRKYVNPFLFPHVLHVSPAVERLVAEAFPGKGTMDVLQGCASLAARVLPRLHATAKGREYSQAEYLVRRPFRAALHLVLWRGEVYMSDEEVVPYT